MSFSYLKSSIGFQSNWRVQVSPYNALFDLPTPPPSSAVDILLTHFAQHMLASCSSLKMPGNSHPRAFALNVKHCSHQSLPPVSLERTWQLAAQSTLGWQPLLMVFWICLNFVLALYGKLQAMTEHSKGSSHFCLMWDSSNGQSLLQSSPLGQPTLSDVHHWLRLFLFSHRSWGTHQHFS